MSENSEYVENRVSGLIRRLIAPVAIVVLIALTAVISLIAIAARGQDDIAARDSVNLMQVVVESLRSDLGKIAYDHTWWDEAIENLIDRPNMEWASLNIGDYAAETFDISDTFIVSETNQTLYAFRDGVPSRAEVHKYFGDSILELIAAARQTPMVEPDPVVGFLVNDEGIHLIAGSAMTPENPTSDQLVFRARPVLIHAQDLSDSMVDALAVKFGFQDLRVTTAPLQGDVLQSPLIGFDGDTVAWMSWTPPHPGSALFSAVLPWFVAGVFVLAVLSIVFVRRVLHTAQVMTVDANTLAEKEHILAQTSKMAVLGEMAAGVVHELNQPLNIIRMASDSTRGLLQKKNREPEFEQLDEQLSVISGQVRRMAETIQSMRIFSRDDYGRKIAFDPAHAANQALSWLRPELSDRGIEISLQAPASCGRVFGEPSRFEQVIVNLLLNARDAVRDIGDDGSARQGAIKLVISEDLAQNTIRIVVSDNGDGVPEENLERLFEPFFTTK
ncbi:MAG: hypothetical protein HOJ90_15425, partial [Alphaproteobacteria bacterium]|nr:hypothetical protein [Alphaproteobacteria bacterium]